MTTSSIFRFYLTQLHGDLSDDEVQRVHNLRRSGKSQCDNSISRRSGQRMNVFNTGTLRVHPRRNPYFGDGTHRSIHSYVQLTLAVEAGVAECSNLFTCLALRQNVLANVHVFRYLLVLIKINTRVWLDHPRLARWQVELHYCLYVGEVSLGSKHGGLFVCSWYIFNAFHLMFYAYVCNCALLL